MAHPWFTGQTGTHAAPSAFPGFRLAPRASASVLACRPGERGRGRDVGLLVALSWEPKVRQQAWRHDCSPRLGVGCPGGPPGQAWPADLSLLGRVLDTVTCGRRPKSLTTWPLLCSLPLWTQPYPCPATAAPPPKHRTAPGESVGSSCGHPSFQAGGSSVFIFLVFGTVVRHLRQGLLKSPQCLWGGRAPTLSHEGLRKLPGLPEPLLPESSPTPRAGAPAAL